MHWHFVSSIFTANFCRSPPPMVAASVGPEDSDMTWGEQKGTRVLTPQIKKEDETTKYNK